MKHFQLLFIGIFFLILVFPWLKIKAPRINGFSEPHGRPAFSLHSVIDSDFQKEFEDYFVDHLPGRPWLLFLHNDIYDIMNLGQFHSGYSGQVLQGSKGVLFEKVYLPPFYTHLNQEELIKLARTVTDKLETVRRLLLSRGVELIIALTPSKPDFCYENIPWLWRFRLGMPVTYAKDIFPYYEKDFDAAHVPYVNCLDSIINAGAQEIAFTDRGIHWSMYGAALCLADISISLHAMNPDFFPIVKIKEMQITREAKHEEEDLAGLLNLLPPYDKGRGEYYLAEYENPARAVPLTIIGDSFCGQLVDNMILSGYIKPGELYRFTNHIPARKDFLAAIDSSKALVIACNSVKFIYTGYLNELLDAVINYLGQ